jgi:hypothetical protein
MELIKSSIYHNPIENKTHIGCESHAGMKKIPAIMYFFSIGIIKYTQLARSPFSIYHFLSASFSSAKKIYIIHTSNVCFEVKLAAKVEIMVIMFSLSHLPELDFIYVHHLSYSKQTHGNIKKSNSLMRY